jgi:signal transduction histidine kinase
VVAGLQLREEVRVDVDCDPDLAVVTNRELVEQALMNLAENAAKQTVKGVIVLSAHAHTDGRVELAVADSGPGIPASERSKIFDRFYRADGDGTTGFGLGLAIVRAVAEALQGELVVDSTVDVGTRFTLTLPRSARLVPQ